MAVLYIIPNVLDPDAFEVSFPGSNLKLIRKLKHFVVETPKVARQLLKKSGVPTPFDNLVFYELDKHKKMPDLQPVINILKNGEDVGLITDAGYPAIADPGEQLISMAHQNSIRVKPLIGPSSIFLALAASGLNAEKFIFHGYLPVKQHFRIKKIMELEKTLRQNHYTQIFMETPYRNEAMLADLKNNLNENTVLCVAANITSAREIIITRSIHEWEKSSINLSKQPAIFLIGEWS